MLSRIQGKVVQGMGMGKKLGFPTANIFSETILIKKYWGVYVSLVTLRNARMPAVSHIGPAKTLNEITPRLEAHILDFDGDIYGEVIEIEFLKKLRNTKKFSTIEKLSEYIARDIRQTREYFHGIRAHGHSVISAPR